MMAYEENPNRSARPNRTRLANLEVFVEKVPVSCVPSTLHAKVGTDDVFVLANRVVESGWTLVAVCLNGTVDVVNLILGFGIKVLVFGSVVSLLEFVLRAEEQVGILKHVVSLSSVV